jgi:soluble lytic murein transglycosylase-like protein
MRINFAGTYKEIQNLLRAPSRPIKREEDAAFERSLGSLLSQPIETSLENKQLVKPAEEPVSAQSPMEEVRASYRFNDPDMMMPEADLLMPPEQATVPSENGGMSVKTPTLLEVKRVALSPEVALVPQVMTPLTTEPQSALATSLNLRPESVSSSVDGLRESLPKESSGANPNILPPQLGQKDIRSRLTMASQKIGLDPSLAISVVNAESGFNTQAVSSDGHNSKGLFQLLDSTGKHLLARADNSARDYDPFDPDLNMELGTSYLRYLHDIFSTPTQLPNSFSTKSAADKESLEKLAVAAFNAGEGRVASAQSRTEKAGKDPALYDNVAPFLPSSTREYVARVVRGKRLF